MEPYLPSRQRRVLQRLANGFTEAEVAHELGVETARIAGIMAEVQRNLGCATKEDAIAWWWRTHNARLGDPAPPQLVKRVLGLGGATVICVAAIAVALFALL
jgi:hypothetical protein